MTIHHPQPIREAFSYKNPFSGVCKTAKKKRAIGGKRENFL
jgi:hypothetical protein